VELPTDIPLPFFIAFFVVYFAICRIVFLSSHPRGLNAASPSRIFVSRCRFLVALDYRVPGVDGRGTKTFSMAGHGWARHGEARRGVARPGAARRGQARRGAARRGAAGLGEAGLGRAILNTKGNVK
jgi:hypothetical protein